MTRYVLLDAGVVGLLCSTPTHPSVAPALGWLARLVALGVEVVLPDIVDYEVRRELNRLGASVKLGRLGSLRDEFRTIPVTFESLTRAAEFWAITRKAGRPTADRHALDGDAILAGVAATIGSPGDEVTIATTNVGHLARFPGVDAREWGSIA